MSGEWNPQRVRLRVEDLEMNEFKYLVSFVSAARGTEAEIKQTVAGLWRDESMTIGEAVERREVFGKLKKP